jgi:RNA polymerase sigma-70 factor (ECF subfamily)
MISALESTLLVKQAQEGNQEAFATLVEYFEREIRNYLILHLGDYDEANDVSQQVFLKAWLNLDSLHDVACFRFWLFTIVKHQVCDYWRRKKARNQSWEDLELDDRLAGLPGPEDIIERAELIRLTLTSLSSKQRQCLVLRSEGFTPDEIAAIVGISSASVSTCLCTARRQFRVIYRQLENENRPVLLTV